MTLAWFPGAPGISAERNSAHRKIFLNGTDIYLPGGRIIDGAKSRDPDNTGNYGVLRAGLLMGKITTGGKYAPSIMGVVQSAYTSGGTALTVSAAQAVEINRRIGASGSLKAIGPPTAAGTVATTAVTYSAIDTSTGILTVTSLGVDKIAGTFITGTDGSQTPITFVPDNENGILVIDQDGSSVSAVDFPKVPIAGNIYVTNIVNWPTDTSLIAWVEAALNGADGGQFVFSSRY